MAGSRISTVLSTSVTLGSSGYESPLLITAGGGIEPGMTQDAGPALYAPAGMTNLAVRNLGHVVGADGEPSDHRKGGHGGAGVDLMSAAKLYNAGFILGGSGGYGFYGGGDAGVGITLAAGGKLINTGNLAGGSGGNAYYGNGGTGADAADIGMSGTLINSGVIAGGAGGLYLGNLGDGYAHGKGGIGVDLSGTGKIVNSGTIAGGYGGDDIGGRGVVLNAGTLTNAGTIEGGNALYGRADAVVLGQGAATLVVDPGAVFVGAVVADAKAADLLDLAGTGTGTLSGLGSSLKGFSAVQVDAGASWVLNDANTLGGNTALTDLGTLTVAGSLIDSGSLTVGNKALLQTGATGTIASAGVALARGTLLASDGGTFVIGKGLTGGEAGAIVVQAGATISGFGTIASPLVDGGVVAAAGGTLTLTGAVSGSGALTLGDKTTLLAVGTLGVASVTFEAGHATLALTDPALASSLISGFGAGDKIDLLNITATGLAFQNGILTIDDGNTVIGTLAFAGAYAPDNFALRADMHGGTDIVFHAAEPDPLQVGSDRVGAMPNGSGFPGEKVEFPGMTWPAHVPW